MMGSAEGLQASNNVSMHYEIYNIAPYERFKAPESLILAFNIWKSPTGHLVLTPHTHASIWLCAVCCRRTVRVIIPAPHSFGWSEILMGPCSGPKGYLCSQQRQRRKSEGILWMRPIKEKNFPTLLHIGCSCRGVNVHWIITTESKRSIGRASERMWTPDEGFQCKTSFHRCNMSKTPPYHHVALHLCRLDESLLLHGSLAARRRSAALDRLQLWTFCAAAASARSPADPPPPAPPSRSLR